MKYLYKIPFEEGFHSRPAIALTELTRKYKDIEFIISKINNKETNVKCKSLIAILTANIQQYDEIEISINGDDKNNEIKIELDKIFGVV